MALASLQEGLRVNMFKPNSRVRGNAAPSFGTFTVETAGLPWPVVAAVRDATKVGRAESRVSEAGRDVSDLRTGEADRPAASRASVREFG